jgi:uncharacterized repeat protein (TIGR01451 family)
VVVATAQVSADNAFSVESNATLAFSSPQKLVFEDTAEWHKPDGTTQNLVLAKNPTFVRTNLGDIVCDYVDDYTNAGYVVFKTKASGSSLSSLDLKINDSDGPVYLAYNSQATLSWTSNNVSSCLAGGDWTGDRAVSGSEMTSSLTSSKTYTLVCTGPQGQVQDTVKALISPSETLSVALQAFPNSGAAPLNGVDLKATVSGTALGTINYKFDCTSDGTWEYNFSAVNDNPKTVVDACNYATAGSYVVKVRVERGQALPAEASLPIVVGVSPGNSGDINIAKLARNLSDGTGFGSLVQANPGEIIEFQISIVSASQNLVSNLVVKDVLPDKMSYYGNLKVDNVSATGDILTGLNIGDLAAGQTKTVSFQAVLNGVENFGFGETDLFNTALVYNTVLARTVTAKITVSKTGVQGATTVPTGIFDNFRFIFLLSLAGLFFFGYLYLSRFYLGRQVYVWGGLDIKKSLAGLLPKTAGQKARLRLIRTVEEIRKKEDF